ncbi:hypothetical protein NQ317_006583 [Molorchus minor]|uniref:NudC N-terminal domain-containing protein n=1 Tax=Molorchus minor TaxID=1323400 RepID=A0ABQ9JYX0_9CUCU|nr:hypothetical protein NQ317_006583 [Molorchus minor]
MDEIEQNQDDILFEMLKECKTLPNFLDQVFGFLQRRTDFYHIATEPNAVVGLPEGLAEKLIKHTFYKWKPQTSDCQTIYTSTDIPTCGEEIVVAECEVVNERRKPCDFSFVKSEYYNGAMYRNYSWSQTILEVHVVIRGSKNVTKKI